MSPPVDLKVMKKNKNPDDESALTVDLQAIIHQNSLFFDKLIDLIPAKFYLPVDEKEKPWFQGLSKFEKAEAKKESKENIKKARRERLNPEKSLRTLDLLKQSIDKEKDEESEDEEIEVRPIMPVLEDESESVTYEELRQRLRRKIEELRGGRNNGSSEKAKRRNERSGEKKNPSKKRKRDSVSEVESSSLAGNPVVEVEKDVAEAAKELTFSRVKLGSDEDDKLGKKKKAKLSKLKELEHALKLVEAKKDPEKGETIAKKHSWKAAMSRASGMKVHDNPKLIKQSMKKGEKRHQKNAEKWKERHETMQKNRAEKHKKRSENIAGKIQQKKTRRIEKREKKLLRPGFEGRKEGFINEQGLN